MGELSGESNPQLVIPAQAGIQLLLCRREARSWIPAFAGMTKVEGGAMRV
jgi:hypothetical protein